MIFAAKNWRAHLFGGKPGGMSRFGGGFGGDDPTVATPPGGMEGGAQDESQPSISKSSQEGDRRTRFLLGRWKEVPRTSRVRWMGGGVLCVDFTFWRGLNIHGREFTLFWRAIKTYVNTYVITYVFNITKKKKRGVYL